MAVTLKVPYVTQLGIGGHVKGAQTRDDPTGCWYASACMVGYYFGAGPRMGVPELFKQNLGKGLFERLFKRKLGHFATGSNEANKLSPNHHALLAKREHLAPVKGCQGAHDYTVDELEDLLRKGGPIFFYWTKSHAGGSYGHASVVIGVKNKEVIYHDPESAPNARMSIAEFNARRQRWQYALMQREGAGGVKARARMFGG